MSKWIAYFIILTVVSIVFAMLKRGWHLITGKGKPLSTIQGTKDSANQSADSNKDILNSDQSAFIPVHESPNNEMLAGLESKICSYHAKACNGLAIIDLLKPRGHFDYISAEEIMVGQLHIAVCEDCIPVVVPLNTEKFTWRRKNHDEHPSWGLHFILPHLLYNRFARLRSVINLRENGKFSECVNDKCKPQYETNNQKQSPFHPPHEIVKKYMDCIDEKVNVNDPYILDDIPRKKLNNAINTYAASAIKEKPLLLIDSTVFGSGKSGLLITDAKLYTSNGKNSDNGISWEDIKTVEFAFKLKDIFNQRERNPRYETIQINSDFMVDVVFLNRAGSDYIINMLRDLAKTDRSRSVL